MEHITTGHIIFAIVGILAYVILLFFANKKDKKTHDEHYKGNAKNILFAIVVLMFIVYVVDKLI